MTRDPDVQAAVDDETGHLAGDGVSWTDPEPLADWERELLEQKAERDVGVIARAIHAADVEIHRGDHPAWDDLTGSGRAQYRQAARHLLARFTITPKEPA
ncbi:hypothetical protein [Actinomadura sp. 21ATH]|uniref:hypothetical protein n=1 Tax=Actinomadura sp. 21ATH TaxID=1735444 RepID=UPI0035BEF062